MLCIGIFYVVIIFGNYLTKDIKLVITVFLRKFIIICRYYFENIECLIYFEFIFDICKIEMGEYFQRGMSCALHPFKSDPSYLAVNRVLPLEICNENVVLTLLDRLRSPE